MLYNQNMKKLLFILVLLAGCKEEESNVNIPRGSEFTKGFTVYESFSGQKKWFLKADSAITMKDSIRIYGVHLKFLDKERERSTVVSDSGLVLERSGDLKAYGDVRVLTGDSIKLYTDSLSWDNRNEKILVKGGFKYISKREEFEGEGLESDPELKHIIVKRKIKGKGSIEEK